MTEEINKEVNVDRKKERKKHQCLRFEILQNLGRLGTMMRNYRKCLKNKE
jgi:hypothetical protein